MAFKFVVFAAFVAVASAGHLGLGVSPLGHGLVSGYAAHSPLVAHSSSVVAHGAPLAHSYAAPVVAAHAAPLAVAAPVVKTVVADAPAHYDYGYSVSDPHTGDHKSAVETRRGDVVQGQYSLVDSDGTKRTVDYTADPHNGFNAVVSKQPLGVAVKAVAAPVAVAAPAVATYAAHAPAVATYAAHAPAAYAAQVAAPAVAHGYAAPALAHGYAGAALAHGYAAPALAHGYAGAALAHGYAAPALAHGYAAPVAAAHYAHAHPVAQAW